MVSLLLLVTGVSYVVASRDAVMVAPFTLLIAGGALAATWAAMLHNYLEQDLDTLMPWTCRRPLASRAVTHPECIPWVGIACMLVGTLLALLINPLVA